MTRPSGEMPFLDHLEELRFRILRSLLAVIIGVGLGIWGTAHFNLVKVLSAPIAPYLLNHKLAIHGVTDQVMAVLKIGASFGLAVAAPFVLYQVWAFLSPALYAREKKAVLPALGVGFVLFFIGVAIGWFYVTPMGLDFLMNFMPDTFNNFITMDEYLSFVMQVLLAFGISFELPLVMVLLAWIGIMSYQKYSSLRRYAIVVNFFLGAILSPGTDVFSMIVFTIPLLVLYELGVAGAYIVARRKRLRDAAVAGIILLALCGLPQGLHAQVPSKPLTSGRAPPTAQDTMRRAPITRTLDSAAAKRLGLPDKPTVTFPAPDSIAQALLSRKGFGVTEMVGDSAVLSPDGPKFVINGHAGIRRDTSTFEARQLRYDNVTCELVGSGEPHLFQGVPPRPLVGRITSINTCHERVVVSDAFTSVNEMGGDWFLRGNFAIDSSGSRFYMAHGEFTSCDLPIPDYHFTASQVKWVANAIIVARPAVLYVRDVPLVWLPFIFQDTKSKRSSGILIPRFGFNDIVRPERTYNRAITNLGYYWAPNDYIDVKAQVDWYANRYLAYGANLRYNWRNRFLDGDFAYSKQVQDNGANGLTLGWTHNQRFNIATTIQLSFNYMSNATVVRNNAIDPLLNTASIRSSLNFTKRLRWGNVTIGGNRSESISDGSGTMTLPSLSISPGDFALSRLITWSPNLQVTNDLQFKLAPNSPGVIIGNGTLDTSRTTGHSRLSRVSLPTPLRIGQFTLNNNITLNDQLTVNRVTRTIRRPDSTTADLNDSVTVSLTREGSFSSGIDFNTGINLPQLLRNSWKVTPTVGITNIVVNFPLFYRSDATNGKWVMQGKKLQFRLAAAPNFYVLTRGAVGPAARLRYALSPQLSFEYAPKATLPSDFAKALTDGGLQTPTATPAAMTGSITLSQNIQAKPHRAPSDTLSASSTARPITVLSINTTTVSYDFEQAKLPGRTGWTTSTLNNTLGSDLLPGFSLSIGHDLWKGQVGSDTAKFSPYLSNVAANFSLSSRTFNGLARLLGLASRSVATGPLAPPPAQVPSRQGMFGSSSTGLPPALGRTGLTASVNYTLSRPRPNAGINVPSVPEDPFGRPPIIIPIATNSQSSVGLNMSFSPTMYWAVRWQTQYNATAKRFESQQIQLERTLHDWRATFNFTKNANGNYALVFSIFLMRLTDIKFDYQQQTIQP